MVRKEQLVHRGLQAQLAQQVVRRGQQVQQAQLEKRVFKDLQVYKV